ncbi:glycosyltransferase family 39 protein [Candidatus Micrarchaeota archaeon]|nr:glycosyltransferase family 39 protein [Candidatus Micrarchaeota archaeon]
MNALSFIGLAFGYFIPGYLLSYYLFKKIDSLERIVFSSAFSIVFIGAFMHLLGITSGFSLASAIAVPLAFSAIFFFLNRRKIPVPKISKFVFPSFSNFEKAVLLFVLVQVALAFYYALFFPIEGGDPVLYHAPYAKWFFESGAIYNVDGVLDCCNAFPHGIHVFNSWFYFLEGNADDFFARLLAPVSSLLSGLLAFLFAKKFFDRQTAFFALLVFYSIPLVVAHSSIAYFNLVEAFLEGTAFYFLFSALKEKSARCFIASGLLGGFLPLIKPSGAIFFFIAFFPLFLFFRPKLRHVALFFVSSLLMLAPLWYARNYFEFGNPVYPHSFFGSDKPYRMLPYEFAPFYFFDKIVGVAGGLGPFLLSFGLAGIVFAGFKRLEPKFCLLWLVGVIIFTSLFTQDLRFTLLGVFQIAVFSANGMRELLARNNGLWRKAIILLIILQLLPALFFGLFSFKTSQIAYGEQTLSLRVGFPPPSSEDFLKTLYGSDVYDAFVFIRTQTPEDSKVFSTEPLVYLFNRRVYLPKNLNLSEDVGEAVEVLKEKQISYVFFTVMDRKGFSISKNPIFENLNNTAYFEKVFGKENAEVYLVK